MAVQRFTSITHLHVFAIINTLIKFRYRPSNCLSIRILDVGCGNGIMMNTLIKELSKRHPDIQFDFYGIDVDDSQVQQEGYFDKTISLLKDSEPGIDWNRKLYLLKSAHNWPFPENYFDIIVSNQVMEHVFNQEFLLSEIYRTMKDDGYSFHLYPLRHYIYEGHLFIPFVHKFQNWTSTYFWIKWFNFFRIGTYQKHKKLNLTSSLYEFSVSHADYMAYQVNYQTAKQIAATARHCKLKCSFDFTSLFYKQKIRNLLKLKPLEEYREKDIMSLRNSIYFIFLKYINCITLVLRKNSSF